MAENDTSRNFWTVPADDGEFWDAYIRTRPAYSNDFYDEIFSYHAAHSTSWQTSHDVGCGAGQVTEKLATRFSQVIASDINQAHVNVTEANMKGRSEQHLSQSLNPNVDGAFEFRCLSAEAMGTYFPPGSADLIASAEAITLMDESKSLPSFASVLKPGGTLALWFYGRPTFADNDQHAACQTLLDNIMRISFKKAFRDSDEQRIASLKSCSDKMHSWLDYLEFDVEVWKDVRRISWNRSFATLPFYAGDSAGFEVEYVNNIAAGEIVDQRHDLDWWSNMWDIDKLRDYFRVLFPTFRETVKGDQTIESLFKCLEDEMAKSNGQSKFTWPAVLILACKR